MGLSFSSFLASSSSCRQRLVESHQRVALRLSSCASNPLIAVIYVVTTMIASSWCNRKEHSCRLLIRRLQICIILLELEINYLYPSFVRTTRQKTRALGAKDSTTHDSHNSESLQKKALPFVEYVKPIGFERIFLEASSNALVSSIICTSIVLDRLFVSVIGNNIKDRIGWSRFIAILQSSNWSQRGREPWPFSKRLLSSRHFCCWSAS